MAKLSPIFQDAQLDGNGNPMRDGRLFTWLAGSFTKRTVFKDSAELANHTNPIILNVRGEPASPIYLDEGISYRFGLAAANDFSDPPSALIRDIDVVQGVNDTGVITISEWIDSGLVATFVNATSFTFPGDQTSIFHVNRRVRSFNTGGTAYSTIVTSVFTTLTTVTVVNDGISIDSGLGAVAYGIISSVNTSSPPLLLVRKNLIWNGAMECWQDGTSETGVTATTKRVADGYLFELATQGTWTVERSTVVPTVAQAGRNLNFSHRCLVTTAEGAPAAGDFAALRFTVEGFDYQELYQQPQHISAWVRSAVTGTYCLALVNDVPDRSFVFEYQINAANTFELKQFPLTAIPSGGLWDFQTGRGLLLRFTLSAGSTFQTTPNAWQTGNFFGTSAQINLAATVNNDFFLADLRLHGGVIRSPVYVPSFTEILGEAQRRFFKTFPYATKPAQNAGSAGNIASSASGTSLRSNWRYPTEMRVSPTVTTFNPSAADGKWSRPAADILASTLDGNTSGVILIQGENAVDQGAYTIHVTADARFS
ncbi:MAG: hypothetical protein ACRD98_00475 [Nitrososphaera sp.]